MNKAASTKTLELVDDADADAAVAEESEKEVERKFPIASNHECCR